jgi:hypothetical protein
MAVVPSAAGARLMPVDARTLVPVRGAWSRVVGDSVVALSPSGSRIAVDTPSAVVLAVDTATGRVVRKYRNLVEDFHTLHWLGGDGTVRTRPEIFIGEGDGIAWAKVSNRPDTHPYGGHWGDQAALKDGLVFLYPPDDFAFLGRSTSNGGLLSISGAFHKLPTPPPLRVVADVAHDRVYIISSAGLVAEIDRLANTDRQARVRYHRVSLNGRPFQAAWAGAGKIALWGEDGLGTIDTRTWKTRAIAPAVTGAIATRFGIAAWTDGLRDGLTVYWPDGRVRMEVLVGEDKKIRAAQTVGGYLYVEAGADDRYSVDLRTRVVVGPLRSKAMIIAPSLVSIP